MEGSRVAQQPGRRQGDGQAGAAPQARRAALRGYPLPQLGDFACGLAELLARVLVGVWYASRLPSASYRQLRREAGAVEGGRPASDKYRLRQLGRFQVTSAQGGSQIS